ncbi:MAG: transcriptional regulator TrmB [Candidatus Peregrinibacteria bacterium Greene0416_62]|nr:MAG: transcriptional regulator TrmB [Candidatus Peregrinibacteria bacterium Greene0416_62]TSD00763.1 MAG: transcriptional regulator TrmB [Candidatus Peregrinibacteria bacterium Greene1014_49]
MIHADLFQTLGLSPNESRIYEALLTFGGSGVSTIALRSGVHRRNAYDAIHRLIEKGLVSEVFSQGETIYEAVEPGKLMEFVKEKERLLDAALPGLFSTYRSQRAVQRAYIYKGVEGMKNFLREALKVGEDMYEFGAKGAWFDPRLDTFLRWFLVEAKKKKMTFHHIFDWEVQEKVPHVPEIVGKPYKFAPKAYTSESAIEVFGDHVVTFSGLGFGKVEDDLTIFVMVSPRLAESYRIWWQMMWDLLPEPGKQKTPRKKK